MIRFDRASKRYPNGREALTAASFEIGDGEMAFLTGRSGAGKSTILKLISLLERPTRGHLVAFGPHHGTGFLTALQGIDDNQQIFAGNILHQFDPCRSAVKDLDLIRNMKTAWCSRITGC